MAGIAVQQSQAKQNVNQLGLMVLRYFPTPRSRQTFTNIGVHRVCFYTRIHAIHTHKYAHIYTRWWWWMRELQRGKEKDRPHAPAYIELFCVCTYTQIIYTHVNSRVTYIHTQAYET